MGLIGVAGLTTGAEPASAHHRDRLLAPKSVCPKQTDRSLRVKRQQAIMRCMHNYARKKRGKGTLRAQRKLTWSARRKAEEILKCQQFSHNACGREAFYWMRRTGFMRGCYGANENLALGSGRKGSVRRVMSSWLHSDGHRRALLHGRHRKFGIGMVRGSYRGLRRVQVWAAHFGYRC